MNRCEKGCEILKGHAFCGKHGLKAEADAAELHKACTAACGKDDLLKADVFCSGCGEKQDGGAEEFGDLIKSMNEYATARASLIDDDLATFPTIDEAAVAARADGSEMLKSLPAQHTETGEISIDSMPLVAALLKAVNTQGVTLETHTQHLLKAVVQMGTNMGARTQMLLKSNAALATKVAELEVRIAGFATQPRAPGKLGVIPGAMLVKAVPGANGGQADERKDLRGGDLLLKAQVLSQEKGGLDSREVELLRGVTEFGGGIPELVAMGKTALAQKVQECVARASN